MTSVSRFSLAAARATLAAGFLLSIPVVSGAQQTPAQTPPSADSLPITLQDAVNRAMGQSEEVQLARTQVDFARAQVRAARSAALPQLDATIAYTRTYESPFAGGGFTIPDSLRFEPDPTAPIEERIRYLEDNAPNAALGALGSLFGNLPFGRPNTWVGSLNGSQTLWAGGRVGAALRIAKEFEQAAELQLQEQVADIELQVRTAYYNALLAREMEAISIAALAQAESFLREEQLRQRAGASSELDVLRAEVAAENLRPQLVSAQNAAELATLDLKRLIDIPLTRPVQLSTPLTVPSAQELAIPEIDPAVLLAQRAALQAQERQVRIREQQVKIARGAMLPSVGLAVTYGRQVQPSRTFNFTGTEWQRDFNASIGIEIPIFTGFRQQAEVQQARIELRQEELRLAQLRENLQLQYEQAIGEKRRAAAALGARQRTVDQAQRVYDLTVLRYQQGLATQLEVTDARLSLLQARTNLAQAISDFYLADAGVARAAGTQAIAPTLRAPNTVNPITPPSVVPPVVTPTTPPPTSTPTNPTNPSNPPTTTTPTTTPRPAASPAAPTPAL